MFTVIFHSRNFQPTTPPGGRFTPIRCSWRNRGAPYRATIAVVTDPRAVPALSAYLGSPITISDPHGDPYWWGYLHGIHTQDGARSHRLNLDELANRVAVLYDDPVETMPRMTPWAEDPASQALYGIRERMLVIDSTDEARALALRDAELGKQKTPQWTAGKPDTTEPAVKLECRGWYDTLGWRYYACAETEPSDTTTQMNAIVSACGQFLAGCRIESTSGILTSPWRDGSRTALEELDGLVALGDAQGRQYRLRIDINRYLIVERVPLPGEADWLVGADGIYRDRYGVRQPGWANPVGRWVRPAGWAYAPAQPLGGGEGAAYVEEWEFIHR